MALDVQTDSAIKEALRNANVSFLERGHVDLATTHEVTQKGLGRLVQTHSTGLDRPEYHVSRS